MITATLRKKDSLPDTSAQPVDENAADKLARDLGVGGDPIPVESSVTVVEASPPRVASHPVAASHAVARPNGGGGIQGEVDERDFKVPQFKIVNGSGELSRKFNQGAVLYADELLWKTPDLTQGAINPVMKFVPVAMLKQWREKLTPEEVAQDIMPRTVNTMAEASRLGGSTEWGPNSEQPRWQPSARCMLLLQEPEGSTHSGFCYTLDGKQYAPAIYYCAGMAYREFFTVINSRVALNNGVLDKNVWQFAVGRKPAGNFFVWVPALKMLREEVGPEVRAMTARLNGVPAAAVEAEA